MKAGKKEKLPLSQNLKTFNNIDRLKFP